MNKLLGFKELTNKIEYDFGLGESFDVEVREIRLFPKKINTYFLSGLTANQQCIKIIEGILAIPKVRDYSFNLIKENISHHTVKIISSYQEIKEELLNGMLVMIFEDSTQVISIDVRELPTRSIAEPDMEKVIRGAHDGFTENFSINIALLRRRIKDTRLRNEVFKIGNASSTTVCFVYIKNICANEMIFFIRNKLKAIEVEHLIMADKALEELLIPHHFNPYPLVRYTERADIVAVHLYQGMFALFVDTSPSVILAPATLADHIQHAEEYRQTPVAGTYLRFIRYCGIILSLFLTPIWLLIIKEQNLGGILSILKPDNTITINIYIQVLIAEVGVEFLRMASIHTPTALSTAMGLIAGILLGDIAVAVGLFAIQTVLVIAISAIGTYVTPSYELGLANKISKLFFIIAIMIFGFWGFIISILLWIVNLALLKSFKKPYLYPFIPFNIRRLLKIFIRFPYKNKEVKNG